MTSKSDLKARVRARMHVSGESYTTARMHVLREKIRLFGEVSVAREVAKASHIPQLGALVPFEIALKPGYAFMSIAARLADFPYCDVQSPYAAAVDQYFGAYREHAAIKTLRFLRDRRGFNYWYLMHFAASLREITEFSLFLPVPPPQWDKKATWTEDELETLRAQLCELAHQSDAQVFLERHAESYRVATERLSNVVDRRKFASWLTWFHGPSPELRYCLAPALLAGGNHCVALEPPTGPHVLSAYLTTWDAFDEQGMPHYIQNQESRLVQLFTALRVNAEAAIHEGILRPASEEIFTLAAPDLCAEQDGWHGLMAHAIATAVVAIFFRQHDDENELKRWVVKQLQDGQLFWIPSVLEWFREFADNRRLYPKLGDFMPRLAARLAELSEQAKSKEFLREIETRQRDRAARAPQIVSIEPAIGATDVDPDLQAITVVFDRKMRPHSWAVVSVPDKIQPHGPGDPSYDDSGTVFTLPVRLTPDTEYAFRLNAAPYTAFFDEAGNALTSTYCTFRTGERRQVT